MKRAIAWLLTLALLISAFPAAAFAAEEPSVTPDAGDVTVEGTNGFGALLSEDITENEAATEEEAAAYEGGYSVSDLEIAGNTAVVTYDTLEEALLVVSLYTEDGLQMLLSANTTVTADATEATVTFDGTMPQYFLASAYLLDVYDLSPLCAAYDTPIYTQEMQELLASTVEDYDEALVLQLDEDDATNFAVYQETTRIIEYVDGFNTVASVDDESMTYVIENADEQFTTLATGDIFAYAYSDTDILISKISAIAVDGTTVTITGEDVEMEEVFSHVKIEADGNTADMTVDESTAEEGVTYAGLVAEDEEEVSPAAQIYSRAAEGGATASLSFKFNIDKTFTSDKDGVSGSSAKVTFEGALKFNVKFDFSYYVSTSKRYVKFLVDAGVSLSASVSGELKAQLLRLPSLGVSPVPGVYIGLEPHVEFQFSAKLELNCTYSFKIGFSYDNKSGATNLGSAPKVTSKVNFEGSIFLGIDLNPHIQLIGGAVADISLKGLVGIEFEGEMTGTVFEEEDFSNAPKECIHGCNRCLSGSIHAKVELGLTLEFLKCSFLTVDVNLFTGKYKIADLYYSFDNTEFGWGSCPHMAYRVTLIAKLLDYLPNITICTANKAGNLTELGVTDKNGILLVYLPEGTYSFVAKLSDTQSLSKQQTVDQACKVQLDNTTIAKSYTYLMGSVESADAGNIVDSGKCGDNVKWVLTDTGLLTISGTGTMYDYDWDSPFSENESIKKIVIKRGVTSIGDSAFSYCTGLTSVTIPDSVTSIGDSAFYACYSLTSVTIPDSVTSIGELAFAWCDYLTSITIPNSVTSIGEGAFYACTSLQKIEVAEDNPNYSSDAQGVLFNKDKSLLISAPGGIQGTYLIADYVTNINLYAFDYCLNLQKFEVAPGNPNFSSDVSGVLFNKEKTKLLFAPRAIQGKYKIPDSVTSIGDWAFEYCESLMSVTIPDGVTFIGEYSFAWCTSLTSIAIPDSVTSIGEGAFYACENLTSVTIPDSVTSIGDFAFYACESLTSVTIPDSITSLGEYAFCGCTNLASITISNSISSIGKYVFDGCTSLTSITIPDSVTSIGEWAFYDCNSLTSVTIPDSVTSISDSAFRDCSSLTSVTIPDSVTSIGDFAFYACESLTSVTISDSITSLGEYAFCECTNLTSITIPDSVTSIGDFAFCACESLTSVTIPDSVTSIGEYAFCECTNLTSITIPDSVASIGDFAFYACESLTSVTIPDSVTSIGKYAFGWFGRLTSIVFKGDAPTFGDSVFCYVTASAYYPAGNETWTADVMQNYGGAITWVPYTLDENGEMVTGEATVIATAAMEEMAAVKSEVVEEAPSVEETGIEEPVIEISDVLRDSAQTAATAGLPSIGKLPAENPGNTANPDAVFGGDYTTEVTDSYTLKNASFTGLVPGQQYVLLAMVSTEVEDPLAPDNLLYIDQAEALEDGTLSFRYVQRVSTDISYVVACGASNKDLADAQITFPEMESDIQNQVVSPTVVYDGVTLTEGQDYVVVGTVSFTEVGTYTCYIRGIRNYTGLVECSYTVAEAPVICAGMSLSLNGDIGVNFYTILRDDIVADENTRMVFNAGGKAYEMALVDSLADTQDDGSVWYRFSCSVPAKGMSDTISAQIYSTDGAVGKVMTYSVAAYYDDICQEFDREEKAALFDMIEDMLNYGAAAQEYFGYNTDDLANAAVSAAVPENVDASAYAAKVTGSDPQLSYAGMSLVLESNTALRVFFRATNGADLSNYIFTVNGQPVTPVEKAGLWYIELTDIAAKDLDTTYCFTAGDVTVQCSALSYVHNVLQKADTLDAKLVSLCKALFAYSQTADAYFAAKN